MRKISLQYKNSLLFVTALDSRSKTGAVRWVACVINNPMRTKHQSCDQSKTSVKGVGERYKKKRLHPNFTLPHTLATLFCSRNNRSLTATRECLLQWRIQGRGLVPLFLDQTEARRAEKSFFGDRAPLVSLGLDDRPPLYLKVWIRHCTVQAQYKRRRQ